MTRLFSSSVIFRTVCAVVLLAFAVGAQAVDVVSEPDAQNWLNNKLNGCKINTSSVI